MVSEPQPNFLTIVPFTDDVKEPRALMGKAARERRDNFNEYEYGYSADQAMAEAAAACSAPARRSAIATCARRRSSTRRP